MTNSKATKKALFTSVISLLLCFTMLMGATFAWFTDTVKSTGNKIVAGNLDVQLLMDTDGNGYIDISDNANPIFGAENSLIAQNNNADTLWEPGKTQVAYLAIKNNGSLALKYNVNLAVENVNKNLYKAMRYEIIPDAKYGDVTSWSGNGKEVNVGTQVVSETVPLEVGATHYFALAIHMQEEAGNEYQDGQVNFDLTVLATQLAAEFDSFDNTYDEDAEFEDVDVARADETVTTAAELEEAITAGSKIIAIDGNITLAKALGASGVTFVGTSSSAGIDFGTYGISGSDIVYKNLTLDNDRAGWYQGMEYGNAQNNTYINCTFTNGLTTYGNSTFKNCTFKELPAGNYPLFLYGGKNITVDGCTFEYGNRAIKIYNEGYTPDVTLTLSNSTFTTSSTSEANKALIEIDDTEKMNSVNVTVNNITVDGALKAQGIYRIDDGALDTSTDKSKVTVNGVNYVSAPESVATAAELQSALDNATGDITINLTADIADDVTVTQKADVDVVINGNGNKFSGVMTVFGNGKQAGTDTLTIKNINFVAEEGEGECIESPGRESTNSYSYSHNVTIENCTFTDPNGGLDCAAIRHGDGGDKNWTIKNCTVDNTMHSLLQVNNVIGKLTVADCTVNSKNGMNLNSCTNVEIDNCKADVKGYAVRFGVSTGGNLGEDKNFVIKNSTLKSANDDGDAVIMFRASAVNATLTLGNTTLVGDPDISGDTDATTINR